MNKNGYQNGIDLGEKAKKNLKQRNLAGNTISGIRSGFNSVDMYTLGFQPGQLITICSYGFYTRFFMIQLIYNIAVKNQVQSDFFSFDIDNKRFSMEMVSLTTKLPLYALNSGMLKETQLKEAEKACDIFPCSLRVFNFFNITTLYELCMEIRANVYSNTLIFIDSLNSIPVDEPIINKKDRYLYILRKLKILAVELQVTIIINYFADGFEEKNNLEKKTSFMQLYSNIQFLLNKDSLNSDDIIDVYNLEIFNRDLMIQREAAFMFNKEFEEFEEVRN